MLAVRFTFIWKCLQATEFKSYVGMLDLNNQISEDVPDKVVLSALSTSRTKLAPSHLTLSGRHISAYELCVCLHMTIV